MSKLSKIFFANSAIRFAFMGGSGDSAKIFVAKKESDLTIEKAIELNALEFNFLQKSIDASGAGTQSKTGFIIDGSMQISAGNDKFIDFFNHITSAKNEKEFWIGKTTEVNEKNNKKDLSYQVKYINVICLGYSLTCDSDCRIVCDISFSFTDSEIGMQANPEGGNAKLAIGNTIKDK